MPNVVVVFGIEMDSVEAELARSVIDLAESGYPSSASDTIRKMSKLGYNKALAVLHRELLKRGRPSLANEALQAINA